MSNLLSALPSLLRLSIEKHVPQSYTTENPPPTTPAPREERGTSEARVKVSPERRYAFPWPDEIPGLGRCHIEAFTPCDSCGTGTWAFFGPWALCLRCANLGRAPLFWDREP